MLVHHHNEYSFIIQQTWATCLSPSLCLFLSLSLSLSLSHTHSSTCSFWILSSPCTSKCLYIIIMSTASSFNKHGQPVSLHLCVSFSLSLSLSLSATHTLLPVASGS